MALTFSVILPTHNRGESLRRAVESVLAQTRRADELIVVNDAADEIDPEIARLSAAAGVRFVCLRRERASLPASRNAGLAAAAGDVLLLMDDDHELGEDYLARLEDIYEADPEGMVDAVSGVVSEPARPARTRPWDLLMALSGHLRWGPRRCLARQRGIPPVLAEILRPTRYLTGGATSLRRRLAAEIRFDEGLAGYALGEDRDFSFRATQRYAVFVAPSMKMLHHCETSARPDARTYGRMIVENFLRIASRAVEPGVGKWVIVGWNLSGLCLAHAIYAVVGDRRYHRQVLLGMLHGLVRAAAAPLAGWRRGQRGGGPCEC